MDLEFYDSDHDISGLTQEVSQNSKNLLPSESSDSEIDVTFVTPVESDLLGDGCDIFNLNPQGSCVLNEYEVIEEFPSPSPVLKPSKVL